MLASKKPPKKDNASVIREIQTVIFAMRPGIILISNIASRFLIRTIASDA